MFTKLPAFVRHLSVWLLIVAFTSFLKLQDTEYPVYLTIIMDVVAKMLYAAFFYIHYLWLIPQYLKKKLYGRYIFGLVVTLAFFPFLVWIDYKVFLALFPGILEKKAFTLKIYITYTLGPILYLIPAIAIRYAVDGLKNEKRAMELEHEKKEAELGFLKAQINPHFLFNAFNSLYALSLRSDPRMPEMVLKMSDLMRYILDYSKKESVSLRDEIKLIEDYLDVQKLRLDEDFDLQFNKNGETDNKTIIPLVLLPIVENCFKHGELSADCFIRLDLTASDHCLTFKAQNVIEEGESGNKTGLENLGKRLQLQYQEQFKLETLRQNGCYFTHLEIPFSND